MNARNTNSLIGRMREGYSILPGIALLTVFFFLFTFYSPSLLAAKKEIEKFQEVEEIVIEGETAEEKLANTLQLIKLETSLSKEEIEKRIEEEGNWLQALFSYISFKRLAPKKLEKLERLNENIEVLHEETLVGFKEVEQMIKKKGLPEEILQRHFDTVSIYNNEFETYRDKYNRVQNANSLVKQDKAINELNEYLDSQKFKRSHEPLDPNNLPFSTPDGKVRAPYTTKEEFQVLLNENDNLVPRIAEKISNTLIKTAQAAHDEPQPEDLLPTIDVQITQPIIDLANQLNNNPVEIYNWVRNNIEFLPTYGSVQGSDMTLQTLKGNAFDTSSLLIALLRASNLPARYAIGTVEIPIDDVMNWVGGVETPQAALQILGQGGIPSVGLTQGGIFKAIRLEHVWVNAYVDFDPSRGSKNIQGDSWVSMDASFKQYNYTSGVNAVNQIPFDAQNFVNTITSGVVVDEQAGTIQNIDEQFIQDQLIQYQQQVETFINGNSPNATIDETIGSKTIISVDSAVLSSTLPYKKLVTLSVFAEMSDSLRHKYRFSLKNRFGGEIFTQEFNLVETTGNTFALSFIPKTLQDEQTLLSFIPSNATEIDDWPTSIPGYLINLESQFILNGQAVQSIGTFQLGEELQSEQALFSPVKGWRTTSDTTIAGEYRAIGIEAVAISQKYDSRNRRKVIANRRYIRKRNSTNDF